MISKSGKCTACMACAEICPKNCISMEQDSYGNLYPQVNEEVCISCGLCEKTCPENELVERHLPKEAYLGAMAEETGNYSSASGGMAYAFYRHMLHDGGCCMGSEWNSNLEVKMSVSEQLEDIEHYRSSKYVMSSMETVYGELRVCLEKKQKALVIGLPCQVAAVKKVFEKYMDAIVCVDLVCHGVASAEYFKQYMKSSGAENTTHITFRNNDGYFITFYDGKNNCIKTEECYDNMYFSAYLDGVCFREDCYHCRYAQRERVGDITIGDYDGLKRETVKNRILLEHKHPSVVLVNTEKGKQFLESCEKIVLEKRDVTEAMVYNGQLNAPSSRPVNRDIFLQLYKDKQDFVKAYADIWRKKQFKKKLVQTRLYKLASRIKKGL